MRCNSRLPESRWIRMGRSRRANKVGSRRAVRVLARLPCGIRDFRLGKNAARVDRRVAVANLEMHMGSGGMTGTSEQCDQSSLFHLIALFDLEFTVVGV